MPIRVAGRLTPVTLPSGPGAGCEGATVPTFIPADTGGFRANPQIAAALHSQISDYFRAQIASGTWPSHHRLRTEPDLAADLGVSRGTLRRALTTLIAEGLLRQVPGKGTFVTATPIEPAIAQKLSTLSEDLRSQGVDVTTTVRGQTLLDAPAPVAALLDMTPGQRVLRLERLRSTEQGPVALLINYVRADIAPGIERVDFGVHSLFGVLENTYKLSIGSGRRTFTAEGATSEVARALAVPEGFPVQYLEQVTHLVDGRPIEYSDVWINSRMMRVTSHLARR
jgi:DNA-binding GntR family transcriptional regulator